MQLLDDVPGRYKQETENAQLRVQEKAQEEMNAIMAEQERTEEEKAELEAGPSPPSVELIPHNTMCRR
jgi:hypothetical protein